MTVAVAEGDGPELGDTEAEGDADVPQYTTKLAPIASNAAHSPLRLLLCTAGSPAQSWVMYNANSTPEPMQVADTEYDA